MKLIISCVFLVIGAIYYTSAASTAAVGLFAPDRYDGIPDMCLMPMDFGHCRAKVKRYYFDMRRMKCAMFYWGGCAGNNNNFKSLEDCNKGCLDAYEDNLQADDDAYYSGRNQGGGANDTPTKNAALNTKSVLSHKYNSKLYSNKNANRASSSSGTSDDIEN